MDIFLIEWEGMTISFGNSRMVFHGSVGSFVMGDIVNGSTGQPADRDHNVAGSGKIKFR